MSDVDPRRRVLDQRDLAGLTAMLADDPRAAVAPLGHGCDQPPLSYLATLRHDAPHDLWRDVPGTGAMARALLASGAPVDGGPGERETPLMTAASYGDAEVAQVLVEAGADLEAVAAPDAGGVPGGTALLHAAVFGMTAVLDVLVAAGARVEDLVMAAAAGDITGRLHPDTAPATRVLALIMAADHQRLRVLDELVAVGTPVDAVDEVWGRHALRLAAGNGRPSAVRRLLELGADPTLRDTGGHTALDLCRAGRAHYADPSGHDEVVALLAR